MVKGLVGRMRIRKVSFKISLQNKISMNYTAIQNVSKVDFCQVFIQ